MGLFIIFMVILIGCVIRLSQRPRITHIHVHLPEQKQEYWDGPVPSKTQAEKNLQGIFRIIEQFPNGVLATENPEYKEEYLKRIDLDLPDGVTTTPD